MDRRLWDEVMDRPGILNAGLMAAFGKLGKFTIERKTLALRSAICQYGKNFVRNLKLSTFGPHLDTYDGHLEALRELVEAERDRQDGKWGTPQVHPHDFWLGILAEEVGEWAEVRFDCMPDAECVEAVHVLAVLFAWLEFFDRATEGMTPLCPECADRKEGIERGKLKVLSPTEWAAELEGGPDYSKPIGELMDEFVL